MGVLDSVREHRTSTLRPQIAHDRRPTVGRLHSGDVRHVRIASIVTGEGVDGRAFTAVRKDADARLAASPWGDTARLAVSRRGRWTATVDVDQDGNAPQVDFDAHAELGDEWQRIDRVTVNHHRIRRAFRAMVGFGARHRGVPAVGAGLVWAGVCLGPGAIIGSAAALSVGVFVAFAVPVCLALAYIDSRPNRD